MSNWEDLRSEARRIKDETLLNLDKYLEQFTVNAEACGAQIHWARDAAEANEIVKTLAREREARLVVKSKSMTTEEIHLNAALETIGVEALETDLGEYIIQLAGETPSHIIAPAIHKTRYQIADLFVEKLGIAPTDDVVMLTATARRVLRQKFAAADIGISGVNFGVAETGTILILENEGNIRLTTAVRGSRSLPQAASALRHRPAPDVVSIVDYRNEAHDGGRGPGTIAHHSFGQWAIEDAGAPHDAAVARVHSLWRLPECLSGLSADWRSCLWLGLSRSDWRGHHAAINWAEEEFAITVRVESVRRVP